MTSVVLMTIDHRYDHLEPVRAALAQAIYPIQWLVDLPVNATEWIWESTKSRKALREENALLQSQNLALKAQLQKYASLEAENIRLRDLLDSSFEVGDRILIAELLAVDLDPYRHQVILNKGANDDVFVGQPVVDAHGVMGQVIHVSPRTATALLITDPSHAVPVQVNRNGLRTIALGTGSPERLDLPFLPNNADIEVGDLLISSGLGGRFPQGYPVATVSLVKPAPDQPFITAHATPAAHMEQSREVLLVWPSAGAMDTFAGETPANDAATQ